MSRASMCLASLRLGRSERALSVIALAIKGSMSRALAMPVIFFRLPPWFLCRSHRATAVPPRARRSRTGTMRAPMSRAFSPASGQTCSGWSKALVGW